MTRAVDLLVLCEDLQARSFIYQALAAIDASLPRKAYFVPYPGKVFPPNEIGARSPRMREGYAVHACGSQHVRENYPVVVRQRRAFAAGRSVAGCRLIVHIDVDNTREDGPSVQKRRDELRTRCELEGVDPPHDSEPVAHLIPRRNIETWIEFLLHGTVVNEFDEYPKLEGHEADAAPAAESFAQRARRGTVPENGPPSLALGLQEFQKIL